MTGERFVIHPTSVVAVQPHPACVVTLTVPFPPVDAIVPESRFKETEQPGGAGAVDDLQAAPKSAAAARAARRMDERIATRTNTALSNLRASRRSRKQDA